VAKSSLTAIAGIGSLDIVRRQISHQEAAYFYWRVFGIHICAILFTNRYLQTS